MMHEHTNICRFIESTLFVHAFNIFLSNVANVHMYVLKYANICTHVYTCTKMNAYKSEFMLVHIYTHTHTYIYIYI